MRIREATPEDWVAVAALLAELGRPDVRDDDEATHRELFLQYLRRQDTVVLVAEIDREVVGFLDMEYLQRLNFLQPQAWIPDLVVAAAERSKGIGGRLLARAEVIATARGCRWMSLESANWREDAHRFYAREGWVDTAKSFTKGLAGQPWPPPPHP